MASYLKTSSIILGKSDYRENDEMIDIFSQEFGRLKILGKGLKKINSKLRSHVEIFSISEIEFVRGQSHNILTDAKTTERFRSIKKDLRKTRLARIASDMIFDLIRYPKKDEKVFYFISDYFKKLEFQKTPVFDAEFSGLHDYFSKNISSLTGYGEDIRVCKMHAYLR